MKRFFLSLFVCLPFVGECSYFNPKGGAAEKTEGLVAFWDFSGTFKSRVGGFDMERKGNVKISDGGPISGKCAEFDGKSYLTLPYSKTGALNVKTNEVTVVAWINWSGEGIGFVGGMWNEYQDGGKRQYGLFVSLPYYNGGDQVCGHISVWSISSLGRALNLPSK